MEKNVNFGKSNKLEIFFVFSKVCNKVTVDILTVVYFMNGNVIDQKSLRIVYTNLTFVIENLSKKLSNPKDSDV